MELKCWCGGDTLRDDPTTCRESPFHDPMSTGRPGKIERLYVAGGMSGHPENNYPGFHHDTELLREAGFLVINPAEYGGDNPTSSYVDLLRTDLIQMLDCDGVAMREGWWESTGARNEVMVAGLLKMPCRSVEDWLARSPNSLLPLPPRRN